MSTKLAFQARGSTHSWKRSIARMSSSVKISGLRPPWTQRNCLFMTAASGRQQNDSIAAS